METRKKLAESRLSLERICLILGFFQVRALLLLLLHQNCFTRLIRLVESARRFRRHVIFVVFCEHLVRAKNTIRCKFSLSHYTLAFLEQVGKNARIYNRNNFGSICNHEIHCYPVSLALDAAFFHQPANSKALAHGCFLIGHLGGAEEEYQIALEGIQDQYGSNTQHSYTRSDDSQ